MLYHFMQFNIRYIVISLILSEPYGFLGCFDPQPHGSPCAYVDHAATSFHWSPSCCWHLQSLCDASPREHIRWNLGWLMVVKTNFIIKIYGIYGIYWDIII